MAYVFVSYVRNNEAEVQRLVEALRRSGVEVWFDRDSLPPGSRWQDAIAKAIRGGAFYIPCFSGEFRARDQTYMHEELAVARKLLRKQGTTNHSWCLPVLVGGSSATQSGLEDDRDFGALHCVDFHADSMEALRQLLAVISPKHSFGRCLNSLPVNASARKRASSIFALDFGTSNSLLSLHDPELGWMPVRDSEGRTYFATAVTFADNWDYWVSSEAITAAYRRPERCITHIKRLLARGAEVNVAHKSFDAVTLASMVIRHLRECAERQFSCSVTDVVIATPAEYSSAQTLALLHACERAGLKVQRIVPESSAAALLTTQWIDRRPDLLQKAAQPVWVKVLVIDIGGGTTDLSVLEVGRVDNEWQFEVLATLGDNELGGVDYDEALRSYIRTALIEASAAAQLVWTATDDARLLDQARQAKERLAVANTTTITLPEVQTHNGELCTLHFELDRATALRAFAALDDQLKQKLEESVAEAAHHMDLNARLDGVLLAGQGSKLWSIAEFLQARFPGVDIEAGFQENAVCRGLGLQAAVLQGSQKDMLLLNATTFAICMRFLRRVEHLRDGESFHVHIEPSSNPQITELISIDTTIPTKSSQHFTSIGPGLLCFEVLELNRRGNVVGVLATLQLQLNEGRQALDIVVEIDANHQILLYLLDVQRQKQASASVRFSTS